MLRYSLAVCAILAVAFPVYADSWADSLFEARTKDFGAVPRGPALTHHFCLTNNTRGPVHVAGVRIGCGCVSASAEKNDLAPGDSTVILTQMDTSRFLGPKRITIYVSFDRPEAIEVGLDLQADSRDDVAVSPDALALGQVKQGATASTAVTVTLQGNGPWQITDAEPESEFVQPTVKQLRRDDTEVSYLLTASLRKDAPVGKWYTEVWLKTSDPSRGRIRVPLTVEVQPPLAASSSPIVPGPVRGGAKPERAIVLHGIGAPAEALASPQKSTAKDRAADADAPRAEKATPVIQGHVIDKNYHPLGKVSIALEGKVVAETSSDGSFTVPLPRPSTRIALTFSADGHVPNTRVFDPRARTSEVVVLWPIAHQVKFEPARELDVKFGESRIRIPAGVVVGSDGKPFLETAELRFTLFDVTSPAERLAASGDYSGKLLDGRGCRLDSYGIFELEARALKGQVLSLRRGAKIDLAIEVPARLRKDAPDKLGFFDFDAKDGRWVQVSDFTLAPGKLTYNGTISGLGAGTHNLDYPHNTVCVTIRVINAWTSAPMANMAVTAHGLQSDSFGTTDTDGYVCLIVKRNSAYSVEAMGTVGTSDYGTPTQLTFTAPNFSSDAKDCGDATRCPFVGNVAVDLLVGEKLGPHREFSGKKAAAEDGAARPKLILQVVERIKTGTRTTDRPLAGAEIAISQEGKRIAADKSGTDGKCTTLLPAGSYVVVVSKAGFNAVTLKVDVGGQGGSREIVLVALESATKK